DQTPEVANPESFRKLVDGIQDYAIFLLDKDGAVQTWNTGAERIKGYRASEVIGKHFSIFYPQDAIHLDWPDQELKTAAREGRFENEGWRLRKDGSRFWASVILTALYDDGGNLYGFAKVTRDMTERMLEKQKLEDSEKALRDLSLNLLKAQDEE